MKCKEKKPLSPTPRAPFFRGKTLSSDRTLFPAKTFYFSPLWPLPFGGKRYLEV